MGEGRLSPEVLKVGQAHPQPRYPRPEHRLCTLSSGVFGDIRDEPRRNYALLATLTALGLLGH